MKLALACALLVCCGGGSDGGGAFLVEWEVLVNQAPVECADVAISEVEVVVTDGEGADTVERFPCEALTATTSEHASGDYTVSVNAFEPPDGVLHGTTTDGMIRAGQVTDLGLFSLPFGVACDSSTCPTGCCDDVGSCIDPQTDLRCGRGGVACANCGAIDQVCNPVEGLCID